MDVREALKMPFPENIAMLPHPSGTGHLLCGMKAHRRLQTVAELAVSRSKYAGKINPDTVFKNLQNIFVERFLKEKRQVNQKESARAVSSAVKRSSATLKDLTHYIPCHLGHLKSPKSFCIGPVVFKQSDRVFIELGSAFQAYLNQKEDEKELGEKLLDETTEYYRSFGWVAEISIDGSEQSISRARALRMVHP